MSPVSELEYSMFLNRQVVNMDKNIGDMKLAVKTMEDGKLFGEHFTQTRNRLEHLKGIRQGLMTAKIEFNALRGSNESQHTSLK